MNREIELLEEIISLIVVSLVILEFRDLRGCINYGLWMSSIGYRGDITILT